MVMKIAPKSSGLLVLSELDYPGWRASVNGKAAPIYSVDGGLRAIPVARGENAIVLRYAPVSIIAGGLLTLLAFGSVLIASFLLWRENRRHDHERAGPANRAYRAAAAP
jgi:uncharacterized membrane protein YfhO